MKDQIWSANMMAIFNEILIYTFAGYAAIFVALFKK